MKYENFENTLLKKQVATEMIKRSLVCRENRVIILNMEKD